MKSRVQLAVAAACVALLGASCNGSSGREVSRQAQIYLAVIDAVLTDDFPASPDDEPVVVYVMPVGEKKIDAAVQADVADGLHDRADLRFADERAEAIVEDDEEMPVRDEGILIAIGDVAADDVEPFEVGVEVYRSVNDSSRLRFSLAPSSSQWLVTASSVVVDEAA